MTEPEMTVLVEFIVLITMLLILRAIYDHVFIWPFQLTLVEYLGGSLLMSIMFLLVVGQMCTYSIVIDMYVTLLGLHMIGGVLVLIGVGIFSFAWILKTILAHVFKKDLNDQSSQHYLRIYQEKLKSNGSLTVNIVQCMTLGPPTVGKTTLIDQLLDSKNSQLMPRKKQSERPCSSPIAASIKKVSVDLSNERTGQFPLTVSIGNEDNHSWKALSLDEEILGYLKKLTLNKSKFMKCSLKKYILFAAMVCFLLLYMYFTYGIMLAEAYGTGLNSEGEKRRSCFRCIFALCALTFLVFILRKMVDLVVLHCRKGIFSSSIAETVVKTTLEHNNVENVQPFFDRTLTIYFRDCGGQPEFHEVLPALVTHSTLFLLMFNLSEDFDKPYEVTYKASEAVTSDPYMSSFTVKESLFQCLASISSIGNYCKPNKSIVKKIVGFIKWMIYSTFFQTKKLVKVIVIGTHKDKLQSSAVENIIQDISQTLREEFPNIMFVRNPIIQQQLLLGIHTFNKDDIEKVKETIKQGVQNGDYKIQIPVPWLALEFCMRKLDSKVISLQECKTLASECNILLESDFNAALSFLHHNVGTVQYFGDVPEMQGVVITDPQILFDIVTDLIVKTFSFVKHCIPGEENRYKNSGRFTEDYLEDFEAVANKQLTVKQIIALLQYLIIIAPVGTNEKGEREYFLPCILVHSSLESQLPNQNLKQKLICTNPPPLLFTYNECRYIPRGIFSCLIAHILSSSKGQWELTSGKIYRDQVRFHVCDSGTIVTIRNLLHYCEITATPPKDSRIPFCSFLPTIVKYLSTCLEYVRNKLNYTSIATHSFGFYCQCNRDETANPNLARVVNHHHTICSKCETTAVLTSEQRAWFAKSSASPAPFRMLEIDDKILKDDCLVDVLRSIIEITDWFSLGLPIHELENIKINGNSVKDCQRRIVSMWLDTGNASWRNLDEALIDPLVNNVRIAKTIREQHPLER